MSRRRSTSGLLARMPAAVRHRARLVRRSISRRSPRRSRAGRRRERASCRLRRRAIRAPTGALQATLPPGATAKDEYDLAYGYVLHKDYALAADTFRTFLRKYPSDRLAPEAQYWLGESLFQQQQYRDAAESFLAVSTKYETTARAPEALFRLGQSLAALGEKEAACASLGEVLRKYPRASQNVKQSVEREQSVTTAEPALRDAEANALFPGLENLPGLVLAVSGGSDSTALLVMAARWAKQLKKRRAQASRRHHRSRAAARSRRAKRPR